ncbi:MAG: heavy metal translocating P-type ATPase, partial [Burkholderiales bacterium]|nr:heavy metal translocating P-type ATPase [Burkholderiales bacterium]
MTCASCVGRVEKALGKVPGVTQASVNLATETAVVQTDGEAAPAALVEAIEAAVDKAGYQVTETHLELAVSGMTCASCVNRIEKALLAVPGVRSASVNLATERASVQAVRGMVDAQRLIEAIRKAGYEASEIKAEQGGEPGEAAPVWRAAWPVGAAVLLSVPLLAPMLAAPLGAHWMLPAWLQWLLATPVQFWLGARF